LGSRDEPHFREALDETDILLEDLVSQARFLGSFSRGQLPLFAGRIGTLAEIDTVPEFFVNKFAGMIEDANDAATFGQEFLVSFKKAILRFLEIGLTQVGAQGECQFIKSQNPTVIARLIIQSDMAAGIQINRHAPLSHGAI